MRAFLKSPPPPVRPVPKRQRGGQTGIAMFMVISSVALLAVLTTELTYSTQLSSRLAYNAVDNLRAYYLAKAGYRFSLLRLAAYASIQRFVEDPGNKSIKTLVFPFVDKVWSLPIPFPPLLPKDAPASIADPIKAFTKASALSGHYLSAISSESSKINLNNIFIRESEDAPSSQARGGDKSSSTDPSRNAPQAPTAPEKREVDFRPIVSSAISALLNQRMAVDEEFAETYRNVTGDDVMDAIESYLKQGSRGSNLPGFKAISTPKEAPLYSMSELHLIPGLDDELLRTFADSFTVYSTAGINVNSAAKETIWGLLPELTSQEIDEVMNKRDDKDVGKPWSDESDFWSAVSATASGQKALSAIQDRFKKAGFKVITSETSFRVNVEATVGQSTRRVEAYVLLGPNAKKAQKKPRGGEAPAPPASSGNPAAPGNPAGDSGSSIIQLVYWRSI